MDKLPIGYIPGKGLPYDKRQKKNPKYRHIKGKLKTGNTTKNIKVISNKHIVKRKGEKFMRLKSSTVAKLLNVRPVVIWCDFAEDLDES